MHSICIWFYSEHIATYILRFLHSLIQCIFWVFDLLMQYAFWVFDILMQYAFWVFLSNMCLSADQSLHASGTKDKEAQQRYKHKRDNSNIHQGYFPRYSSRIFPSIFIKDIFLDIHKKSSIFTKDIFPEGYMTIGQRKIKSFIASTEFLDI